MSDIVTTADPCPSLSRLPFIRSAGGDELRLGGDLGAAGAFGTSGPPSRRRRGRRGRRGRIARRGRHRRVAAQVAPDADAAEVPRRRHSRRVHVVVSVDLIGIGLAFELQGLLRRLQARKGDEMRKW